MMPAVLFNLAIDLVKRKKDNKIFSKRDLPVLFLNFGEFGPCERPCANVLLTLAHPTVQDKTSRLQTYGQQVRLQISFKKTETMTVPN